MSDLLDLRQEAKSALEKVWFVRSLEEIERTDITLSLRLHIGRELFVQNLMQKHLLLSQTARPMRSKLTIGQFS